jgi:hypothetical protein
MQELEIRIKTQPLGFAKPVESTIEAGLFSDGQIVFLSEEGEVEVSQCEQALVRQLKQRAGCIEVQVVHKYK